MRTEVQFKNATFNRTQPQEYFTNPNSAYWASRPTRSPGKRTGAGTSPSEWTEPTTSSSSDSSLATTSRSGSGSDGWKRRGLLRVLLRRRHRGVLPAAVEALNAVLSSSPDVRDLRWVHH